MATKSAAPAAPPEPAIESIDFTPATLRERHDGWTAERQRRFIAVLADCGQVSHAAAAAGMSVRSAYRLRRHPRGRHFHAAWKKAMRVAVDHLVDLAYERAIEGTPQKLWKNGELVAETRRPSDNLLMFLLRRVDPPHFGAQSAPRAASDTTLLNARFSLADHVEAFADVPDLDAPAASPPADPAPRVRTRARARVGA